MVVIRVLFMVVATRRQRPKSDKKLEDLEARTKMLDILRQRNQEKSDVINPKPIEPTRKGPRSLSSVTPEEKKEWLRKMTEAKEKGGMTDIFVRSKMMSTFDFKTVGDEGSIEEKFERYAGVSYEPTRGKLYTSKIKEMQKAAKELDRRLSPLNYEFDVNEERRMNQYFFHSPVPGIHSVENGRRSVSQARIGMDRISEKSGISKGKLKRFIDRIEAQTFLAESLNSLVGTTSQISPTDLEEVRWMPPHKNPKHKKEYEQGVRESGIPVIFPGTIVVPDYHWRRNTEIQGPYSKNLRSRLGNEEWVGGFCAGGNFPKDSPFNELGLQITAEGTAAFLHEDLHQVDLERTKRTGVHRAITELLAYREDIYQEAARNPDIREEMIERGWKIRSDTLKNKYLPDYGETEKTEREQHQLLDDAITQIQRLDRIIGRKPVTQILLNSHRLEEIASYSRITDDGLLRMKHGYSGNQKGFVFEKLGRQLENPTNETENTLWENLRQEEQAEWMAKSRHYLADSKNGKAALMIGLTENQAKKNATNHYQRWYLASQDKRQQLWDTLDEQEQQYWLDRSHLTIGRPGAALREINPDEGYARHQANTHYKQGKHKPKITKEQRKVA